MSALLTQINSIPLRLSKNATRNTKPIMAPYLSKYPILLLVKCCYYVIRSVATKHFLNY